MKRSKRLMAVLAIALILCVVFTTLVACGSKKMKDSEYNTALANGINGLFPENGYYFGIDTEINYMWEKDGKKIEHKLSIKGTLDSDPNSETNDTQLAIELKTREGEAAFKDLFGLYYKDAQDAGIDKWSEIAPLLYVKVLDSRFAFNSYSVKKLIKDLSPSTSSMSDGGIGADTIINAALGALVQKGSAKTKTVKNESINSVVLDINQVWSGLLGGMMTDYKDEIDSILGAAKLNITAEQLIALRFDIPITLTTVFDKVKKGEISKLKRVSLEFDIKRDHNVDIKMDGKEIINYTFEKSKITLAISKLEILSGKKVAIEISDSSKYLLIAPFNVSVDGSLAITDSADASKLKKYDIILRTNVNPIPIAYMGGGTWDIKKEIFKNLGMFHFAIVDKTNRKSFIEIIYDPRVTGNDNVDVTLDIGILSIKNLTMNLSTLEGMMNNISGFIAGNKDYMSNNIEKPSETDVTKMANIAPDFGATIADFISGGIANIVNTIGNLINPDKPLIDKELQGTLDKIAKIVKKLTSEEVGAIKAGTVGANKDIFFEMNLIKIIEEIVSPELGLVDQATADTINGIKGLINGLFGGDTLNLTFTKFEYGVVKSNYNAYNAHMGYNGRTASDIVKSIDSIDGFTPTTKNYTAAEFKTLFAYKALKTAKVTTLDKSVPTANRRYEVYMIEGFDPTKTGEQDITLILKDPAGINGILSALGSVINADDIAKFPIGVEMYRFKVNII